MKTNARQRTFLCCKNQYLRSCVYKNLFTSCFGHSFVLNEQQISNLNMGVQCQILIDKAREGVHRPGDAVRGKVRYIVDEPTEYQDVTLSFIGKGKCIWSQGSNKNRRTYIGREEIIRTHVNVLKKRPEEPMTLDGTYEHPFEFFLPEDIPRSFKDRIGRLSYRIQLKFVKTNFFSFNKKFTAEIPVYSYLYPTSEGPVIFGLEKELFAPFASETPVVNLKAQIEKTCFVPGENIHLSYMVTNDTDVEITSIKTELYRYTTYTADCGAKKYDRTQITHCEAETSSIPEKKSTKLECTLPTQPELYSITNSKVVSVEYKVRATVRLPIPHLNATVEMPVLIGETRGAVDPTLVPDDGAEPPSYWETMYDKKEKK